MLIAKESILIKIVAATTFSEADFLQRTPLGLSIQRLQFDKRISIQIRLENQEGLSTIYNDAITSDDDSEILLFIHDDVWIDDYCVADRLIEAMKVFDIAGVAGNRRRYSGQLGWAFSSTSYKWDSDYISGAVGHGQQPFGAVTYFGQAPAPCELLDGVFLACKKRALIDNDVRFDPTFRFHYYDLDFCRTARQNGLKLGTWPIAVTHQSSGGEGFRSEEWRHMQARYLEKWGEKSAMLTTRNL